MASHAVLQVLLLISSLYSVTNAEFYNCPLLGAVFPKPQNLSGSTIMQAAFQNLSAQISAFDTAVEGEQNSYSLEIFSTSEETSPWTHYHTASNLPSLNSTGVTKVDGSSVYRLGSLTKIFTMYTFLIEAGDIHFSSPITNYVPELQTIAATKQADAITEVSWNDITIGALASHMAGIASDNTLMGELTQTVPDIDNLIALGFPPLPSADIPNCGTWPECNRQDFFSTFSHMEPAFSPFSTAAYSNVAFQLLSYALENITGNNFESMLIDSVINKLNLSNTFYNAPDESRGIIPGTVDSTHWYYSLGDENPAGNMYSSSSDIARFGRSILSYELLSGPQTRRWMKPIEHSSDIYGSIGAPWGVRRIPLPDQKYRVVDSYDKGGQISQWTSFMTLLPDYDVGFIILIAGNDINGLQMELLDAWGSTIIPALEAAAKEQAGELYAGEYVVSSSGQSSPAPTNSTPAKYPILNTTSQNPHKLLNTSISNATFNIRSVQMDFLIINDTLAGAVSPINSSSTNSTLHSPMVFLNSSMTIETDDRPGLSITRWISNGTDMRLTIAQLMTNYSNPYWVDLSIRLYPTDLVVSKNGTRTQSFKAIFEDLNADLVDKTYSTGCATWIGPTAYVYGALALDQFFMSVDSAGVVSIQPQALRVTLQKSSNSSRKKALYP